MWAHQGMCLFSGLCMGFGFVFAAQVSLVVNVASECGFTDQHYRALQQLQRTWGRTTLMCLPSPATSLPAGARQQIRDREFWLRRTYSVSFPMFSKIAATGTGAHPAFKYLTGESSAGWAAEAHWLGDLGPLLHAPSWVDGLF